MDGSKIQKEQDDVAVLGALISFDRGDTIFTIGILSAIVRISVDRVAESIVRMRKCQYVVTHCGKYIITTIGRDYYDEVKHKPEFILSPHEFKNEALTGLDKHGRRSNIDMAALPSPEERTSSCDYEEYIVRKQITAQIKRKTATDLGITIAEFDKRLLDGSLHVCNGIGDGAHIGIFHPHTRDKWRSHCQKCRKIKRKNNG